MKANTVSHVSRYAALVASVLVSAFARAEYLVRENMYDYDQRRQGIAADGAMHCYPTSMVDLFRYMSMHGLPSMNGSYGNSYSDVTDWIEYLGILMMTNPSTGTNASN